MLVLAFAIACNSSGGDDDSRPAATSDDTGTPVDDSSTPPDDSGTSKDDSATPPDDSDTPPDDSDTPPDDSDTVPVVTFDVVLTPNPNMVTQVTAAITLSAAHDVRVTCEAPTKDPWPERIIVRDDAETTKHSLFVDGLLASTTYTCTVEAGGYDRGTFDLTTDALPKGIDFMGATVEFDDATAFEPGWTLFNPTQFPPGGRPGMEANLVVDPMGKIRWYVDMAGQDGDAVFEYDIPHGQFYGGGGFFDAQPVRIWDVDGTEVLSWDDVGVDHDLKWIGEDFYILTQGYDGRNGNHCLAQRDPKKTLVWEWCTDDDSAVNDNVANSMYVRTTKEGTYLYATMQITGIVYKLDRDTKEVLWVYKDGGDFEGDVEYNAWMHDLHVIDCDGYTECLLMYVNGSEEDPTTSIRQVGIDEDTMTATLVREWTEDDWWEQKIGGIDPFAEDRWLIAQGHFVQEPLNDRPTQLVEVAPDDSVVWRLSVATDDIQVYRARRVGACDLFHHAGYCPSLEK
jgi:hypothetical protein